MASLQLLLGTSLVLALAYVMVVTGATILAALRAGGRREELPDSHDAVAASRLTVPVSIIVPAGPEVSPRLAATVESLLRLAYPEFEVIVVADASGGSMESLGTWELEAREFFYRQTLETAGVRRILKSRRDPRLMVVEKAAAPRFDALNCGVNLARYRFVAVVPPDVSFDETALLQTMAPALGDPGSVVGVSSPIERVPDGTTNDSETRFQRLESIRSLVTGRLLWADRPHAIGPDDAVFVWRRDALLQANGFSRLAADPDVDMMFRLQCADGRDERRVVRSASPFGQAAILTAEAAQIRTGARQRSALQMVVTWGASASSALGGSFLLFLRTEALTPIAQGWLVAASIAGAAAGAWSWTVPLLVLLLLAFGTAAASAAALLVRGAHPGAPAAEELRALLLLAPLELPLRGPGRARARLAGLLRMTPSADTSAS
jgi:hypothetical protein